MTQQQQMKGSHSEQVLPERDAAGPEAIPPSSETPISDPPEEIGVSDRLVDLVGSLKVWVADLCELLSLESRLALLSLNKLFVLSLVLAQALFLTLISALVVVGILLNSFFALGPLPIAVFSLAVILAASLAVFFAIRRVSKTIFLGATLGQLRKGLSEPDKNSPEPI